MRLLNEDKQASRYFGITSEEYQNRFVVDAAVIGGREKLLPGDTLITTGLVILRSQSRSFGIIVGVGNEPRIDTVEDSQGSEGLNVGLSRI